MCDEIRTFDELPSFIRELTLYKDVNFQDYEDDINYRSETLDPTEAQVYSSKIKGAENQHLVVLDIDQPAILIPSSTPGHHHLVIVPANPMDWNTYQNLLADLSRAGVIEEGYYRASLDRKATCARLPWVKKSQEAPF